MKESGSKLLLLSIVFEIPVLFWILLLCHEYSLYKICPGKWPISHSLINPVAPFILCQFVTGIGLVFLKRWAYKMVFIFAFCYVLVGLAGIIATFLVENARNVSLLIISTFLTLIGLSYCLLNLKLKSRFIQERIHKSE
jgi:hypothetical protein